MKVVISNLTMGALLTPATLNGFRVSTSSDSIYAFAATPAIVSSHLSAADKPRPLNISFLSVSPIPAGSSVTLSLDCGGLPCISVPEATGIPPHVHFEVGKRVTGSFTYQFTSNSQYAEFVQPIGFLVTDKTAQFQDMFIPGSVHPAASLNQVLLKFSLETGMGNVSNGNQYTKLPFVFSSSCPGSVSITEQNISAIATPMYRSMSLYTGNFFKSVAQQFPWTEVLNPEQMVIGARVSVMVKWTAFASVASTITVVVPIFSSVPYMSFASNSACFLSSDGSIESLTCVPLNSSSWQCDRRSQQTSPSASPSPEPSISRLRTFSFGCNEVTLSTLPVGLEVVNPKLQLSVVVNVANHFDLKIPLSPIQPLSMTLNLISLEPTFVASLVFNFPSAFSANWTLGAVAMSFNGALSGNASFSVTAAVSNPNAAPPSNSLVQVANLSVVALLGPTKPVTYLFGTNGFYVPTQPLPLGNAWASVALVVPSKGPAFLQDCNANTELCAVNLNPGTAGWAPQQPSGCLPPASVSVSGSPFIVSAYSTHSHVPSSGSKSTGKNRKLMQSGTSSAFSYVANVQGASMTSGSSLSNFTAVLYTIPPPPSCSLPCYSLSLRSLRQRPWCNYNNFSLNLQSNESEALTGFKCVDDDCAAATCIVDDFLCKYCTVVSSNKQFNSRTGQCCDPPAFGSNPSCSVCLNPVDGRQLPGNAPPIPKAAAVGPRTCSNSLFVKSFRSPSGTSVDLDVSNLGVAPFPSVLPGTTLPFSSYEDCVLQVQSAFRNQEFVVECPNDEANVQHLQFPFNTILSEAAVDGLESSKIGKSCGGSVCSTSSALVSCSVQFPKLNLEYEGFPYYFTPVTICISEVL